MVRRPPALDLAVAAGLAIAGVVAALGSTPAAIAPTLLYAVPLAWRRTWPLAVGGLTLGAILLLAVVDRDGSQPLIPLAIALASFTLGRLARDRWSGVVLVAALAGYEGLAAARAEPAADAVFLLFLLGGPWLAGAALRRQDALREAHARQAVEDERLRLARELHDVVTHSISVVTLQTQAVRFRLREDQVPEAADLQAVETIARQAMAELRRLLGVLRAGGEAAPLEPQPGLAQLPRLVERSGMPVELRVTGDPAPLAPGVDLAAYRIAQEALTNVARHAGPGVTAVVEIAHAPGEVRVRVSDDGRGPNGGPPGHGLAGMRERVALYGGRLDARARAGGGFVVEAVLPA